MSYNYINQTKHTNKYSNEIVVLHNQQGNASWQQRKGEEDLENTTGIGIQISETNPETGVKNPETAEKEKNPQNLEKN